MAESDEAASVAALTSLYAADRADLNARGQDLLRNHLYRLCRSSLEAPSRRGPQMETNSVSGPGGRVWTCVRPCCGASSVQSNCCNGRRTWFDGWWAQG